MLSRRGFVESDKTKFVQGNTLEPRELKKLLKNTPRTGHLNLTAACWHSEGPQIKFENIKESYEGGVAGCSS